MREIGVYDKWEGFYLNRWEAFENDKENKKLIDFKIASLKHFFSILVICTGMIVLAYLSFITELFGKNKKNSRKGSKLLPFYSHTLRRQPFQRRALERVFAQ